MPLHGGLPIRPASPRMRRIVKANRKKLWLTALWWVAVAAIFVLQLWMAWRRHFTFNFVVEQAHQLFSEDLMGFLMHARQFVEFGRTSTFFWPGYMYHGPVQAVSLMWPGLLLGFHEWIPVVMMAVYGTLIPILCSVIAKKAVSPSAALPALLITGASDVYMASFIFMMAWPFPISISISLILALMMMGWVRRFQEDRMQPGFVFCLTAGLLAGYLFYAHPINVLTLAACALFLLLALGLRLFTWRILAVVGGGFAGSYPFWIYWWRYITPATLEHLWAVKPYRLSLREYFFSSRGFFWFMFSPSNYTALRWIVLLGVVLAFAGIFWTLTIWLVRAARRREWRAHFRDGFPIPLWSYGVCFVLVALPIMRRLSGIASFAGPSHIYACEVWFWFMLAVVAVLNRVMRRNIYAGALLVLFTSAVGYHALISRYPAPSPGVLKLFNAFKADARDMAENHWDPMLVTYGVNGAMYYAYAPRHLMIAEGFRPFGLQDVPLHVERATNVSVATPGLDANTLGRNAWETKKLRTIEVHYNMQMPPGGKLIPSSGWSIDFGDSHDPGLALLRDDNLSTSWLSPAPPPPEGFTWTIKFDEPRTICRMVLLSLRDAVTWRPFTYWRIKAYYLHGHLFQAPESLPRRVTIEGRSADSGEWITMTKNADDCGYHWDGGRLFYGFHERHRLDIRLPPIAVTELRIRDSHKAEQPRLISEMYFFELADDSPNPSDSLDQLASLLRKHDVQRLYAGRFISAQMDARIPSLHVWRPSALGEPNHTVEHQNNWPWFSGFEALDINNAALVSEEAWGDHVAETLHASGISFETEPLGAWRLFLFTGNDAPVEASDLIWNGLTPIRFPGKKYAYDMFVKARDMNAAGETEQAMDHLREALRVYPHYYEAGRLLEKLGEPVAPEAHATWYRKRPPARPLDPPIRFGKGVLLVGIEPERESVRPGEMVKIRYCWKIPTPGVSPWPRPVQFTHLVGPNYTINDDHIWLPYYREHQLIHSLDDELFVEERELTIPPDSPPGDYIFEIGLLNLEGRERLKARTANPSVHIKRNAAFVPGLRVVK